MKLAFSVTGDKALHSSQIHGFSSGKLLHPAPKVLLTVGILNLAIARSNGCPEAGEGPRCPATLSSLFEGKQWLVGPTGNPMGPVEVFQACTGLIDINNSVPVISPDDQAAVSKSLGKFARVKLMQLGSDFMDPNEMGALMNQCPIIESLIHSKEINAAELTAHLEDLAMVCQVSLDELTDFAISPITNRE